MPPDQMLGELQRRNDAFWTDVEAQPDAALTRPGVPLGPGRVLSGLLVCQLRLNEFMLHGWDVAVAHEPAARLDPESAALALEFNVANGARLAQASALEGLNATYRCELSGPGGGPVTIVCRDGKVEMARGAPERADVTLRLAAEALNRLVWGRVALDQALADGTIQVDGDVDQARALGRVFGNR
jgi:uncharacterized protein (TIGR03083 family)